VIVVDSSALIAILRREPEADTFLHVIAAADRCLLSAVSLLETSMVLAGRSGDASSWIDVDTFVAQAGIAVVAHDAALAGATRAAFLRYGKGRHAADLNLGDCVAYALASSLDLSRLFRGNDFVHTDLKPAA
jgi:ribonuclease VapC